MLEQLLWKSSQSQLPYKAINYSKHCITINVVNGKQNERRNDRQAALIAGNYQLGSDN